jgi:lipoprotein-releasing system ATP-binding protein
MAEAPKGRREEPRLIAQGLCKTYRTGEEDIQVLKGLDLEVGAGEIVAIVGVSGVGKSTLLHVLGALDRADEGEVTIGGVPLSRLRSEAMAEVRNRSVGFVFQFHCLLPEFTALENVMMPLLIRRTAPAEARSRALAVLGELGLSKRGSHLTSHLSGGEQQRVAIARALVADPLILLADEPTGTLDLRTGSMVFELLRTLSKGRDMACVVATHNEALAHSCDRILHLCEGVLREVTFGSPPPELREVPRPPAGA